MTDRMRSPLPVLTWEDRREIARAWLAELADADRLTRLDDEALVRDLTELAEVGRLADAGQGFAAGQVAQRSRKELGVRRICAAQGFATPEELVSRVSRSSKADAARRIRQVEPLLPAPSTSGQAAGAAFPVLRAAVSAGLMSPNVAHVITRALQPLLDRAPECDQAPGGQGASHIVERVGEAERTLIVSFLGRETLAAHAGVFGEHARMLMREAEHAGASRRGASVAELARMARSWQTMLAQEAARSLPDHAQRARAQRERIQARRFLRISALREGTCRLEAELLPEVAAQLQLVLDAYGSPKVDDARRGVQAPGARLSVGGALTDRSPEGADAEDGVGAAGCLVGSRGCPVREEDRAADPRSYAQRLHDYFAGFVSLAAGLDGVPKPGGAAPTLLVTATLDQLVDPEGVAFLAGTHHEDHSALDIRAAHHAGCAGRVMCLLTDQQGKPVSLTVTDRVFTAAQRMLMADRDGGCVIPGCTVPASWCEAHHVTEWARGGPTGVDNGVLLCYHHHRELDQLGWDIQIRDGCPWVRPPACLDPQREWRPAQSSLHRHHDHLRAARGLPPPGVGGRSVPGADGESAPGSDGRPVSSGGGRTVPDSGGRPVSSDRGTIRPDSDQATTTKATAPDPSGLHHQDTLFAPTG